MKQKMIREDWDMLTPRGKEYVIDWLKRKGYRELTLGIIIELLIDISPNLHKEDSDGRFFNNILMNEESVVGWDGKEIFDIVWFEDVYWIKQKIINEEVTL